MNFFKKTWWMAILAMVLVFITFPVVEIEQSSLQAQNGPMDRGPLITLTSNIDATVGIQITRPEGMMYSGTGTLMRSRSGTFYVLTAAHVTGAARMQKVEEDEEGEKYVVVWYLQVTLSTPIIENGRHTRSATAVAEVIRHSTDYRFGYDVAILRVVSMSIEARTVFERSRMAFDTRHLPVRGEAIYHLGSPAYPGIYEQFIFTGNIGRLGIQWPNHRVIYDATYLTTIGGCSGGGVYSAKDNRYIGMLVRGLNGLSFHVPNRVIFEFVNKTGMRFLFDSSMSEPSREEIDAGPIDFEE